MDQPPRKLLDQLRDVIRFKPYSIPLKRKRFILNLPEC